MFTVQVLHLISALHLPHLGAQVTPTHILVAFSRLYGRLYTYNAFAFHLAVAAIAIEDLPVAAMKFYGK